MGHAKIVGFYLRLAKERSVKSESGFCRNCFWFSDEYPKYFCLKWDIERHPEDTCRYFLRRGRERSRCENFFERYIKSKYGRRSKRFYDDYGYILEIIPPQSRAKDKQKHTAHIIGEKYFNLLEVTLKEQEHQDYTQLKTMYRVFIGKGEREFVDRVKRRLNYNQLTDSEKQKLPFILDRLVIFQENRFVKVFNMYGKSIDNLGISISLAYSTALMAEINKNKLEILKRAVKERPFKSFNDIISRVDINPIKAIRNRVLCELKNDVQLLCLLPLT